jgi:DNA-binding GntR family transcriptional regulator
MDITTQLRMAILDGKYAPGSLLSQSGLAKHYAVSRIPIRDALQALAADKLVEILPGKGARVIALSPADLQEVFDLRIMLECDLLDRAIRNADDAAKTEVLYRLRRSSLEAGRPGWHTGDWDFHQALYAAANRPRQLAIVDNLRKICIVQASQYASLSSETQQWLQDHEQIADAYVAGRADEAAEMLAAHLGRSLACLLALFERAD